jgi:alkyl hydroperoxide reductase subunit AhpF
MPMISEQDQQAIRDLFADGLKGDVTITHFTQQESKLFVPGQQDCTYCKETRELLEEVAGLSDKLHLVVKDMRDDAADAEQMGIARVPATVLQGQAKGTVRYYGIPAGYEFSNLIHGLVEVSSGEVELSRETTKTLAGLQQDLHLQVFVTPT